MGGGAFAVVLLGPMLYACWRWWWGPILLLNPPIPQVSLRVFFFFFIFFKAEEEEEEEERHPEVERFLEVGPFFLVVMSPFPSSSSSPSFSSHSSSVW